MTVCPYAQTLWTLQSCIDYALQNNIKIKKNRVAQEEGNVSLMQAKGALLPSLSFNTNQSVGYRPFEETTAIVQNGQVTTTSNKVTYQGSYGINANVTLWNGGINQKNIEAQKVQNQILEQNTLQSELSIQEQIVQLYVQILYSQEFQGVSEMLAATASSQYERGKELQREGQISKADLSQLEAQWKRSEYDVINAEIQTLNLKRQLKSLLELDMTADFDIKSTNATDDNVLEPIPSSYTIYQKALELRPEIKAAQLNSDAAELQLDIARRGYYPTIGMSASVGDSHYSASKKSTGEQMKTNLNASAGVNVSVPLFDQRKTKNAINKAKLQKVNSLLDLQDQKNQLASTIEQYWLNANSNQQRFLAAQAKTKSQQESYNLLNEQFKNGLKNIAELLQGRDNLVNAMQDELQSKYNTLLNLQILKFYGGENISL